MEAAGRRRVIHEDLARSLVHKGALFELSIAVFVAGCRRLRGRVDVSAGDRVARSLATLVTHSGLSDLSAHRHVLLGEELLLGVLHELEVIPRTLLHDLHGLLLLIRRQDVLLG